MRQFNLREDVSVEASRDKGNKTPQSGIYIPNYQGVNQVLHKAGGDGEIAFYDALATESSKKIAEYQAVYDNLELGNLFTGYNAEMMKGTRDLQMNNLTGQGYMDSVVALQQQLSQKYESMASNEEVRNKFKLNSLNSLSETANSAFRDQLAITKAYSINQTNLNTQKLKNQLTLNPDMIASIKEQHDTVVETMRPVLPAIEFEEYKKKEDQNFLYSYGMGLIKRSPSQAQQLLAGKEFISGLSSEKYTQLQKFALREEASRLKAQRRMEKDLEKIRDQEAQIGMMKVKIAKLAKTGEDQQMIAEYEQRGIFRELEVKKLELFQAQQDKHEEKENRQNFLIDDAIKNNYPCSPEVTVEAKQKHFYAAVNAENQKRAGSKENPLTLMEQVEILKSNSNGYSSPMPRFGAYLDTIIRSGGNTDNTERFKDACLAIHGEQNLTALKGVSEECFDFSAMAVAMLQNSRDMNQVKKLAAEYFDPKHSNMQEIYQKRWRELKYGSAQLETRNDALDKFLKKAGFALDTHWYGDKVPNINRNSMREETYTILKRIFLRTGSIAMSEATTAYVLNAMYGETEINGVKQFMEYPPEKVSSQSLITLQNVVAAGGQRLVSGIEKAGDRYLGAVKIKKIKDFISPKSLGNIQEYFNKDLTISKNRTVEAMIDGVWKKRNLNISPVSNSPGKYFYYILLDEEDSNSWLPITDPEDGEVATVDLSEEGFQKLLYRKASRQKNTRKE